MRQTCSAVSVALEDEAVADYVDEQVDAGRHPERFGRVWVHTHPGECPRPSGTDEETFARAFGGMDWAVMAILARGGESYARLRFGCGPGAELVVPVRVDYGAPFPAADHEAWRADYESCVRTGFPRPEPLTGADFRRSTRQGGPATAAADAAEHGLPGAACDSWDQPAGWDLLDEFVFEPRAADPAG